MSVLGLENAICETLSSRRPLCVNPNSSKGIIGLPSDRMSFERISAEDREKKRTMKTRKQNKRGD